MKKVLFLFLFFGFASIISDQQKFEFEIKITKTMTLSEAAKLEKKIKDFLKDDSLSITIDIVKPEAINQYLPWRVPDNSLYYME